jgi:large subunit ribosomal protein L27
MAHVKAGGTAAGNKDSVSKRLGVKVYGGQMAQPGSIIVRQKGTKVYPGAGVRLARDYTIYSVTKGLVAFSQKLGKKVVSVMPAGR